MYNQQNDQLAKPSYSQSQHFSEALSKPFIIIIIIIIIIIVFWNEWFSKPYIEKNNSTFKTVSWSAAIKSWKTIQSDFGWTFRMNDQQNHYSQS